LTKPTHTFTHVLVVTIRPLKTRSIPEKGKPYVTDYIKVNALIQVSEQADYNNPVAHAAEVEDTTGTNSVIRQKVTAATTGTTVSLAHLASTVAVLVENTDSTNTLFAKVVTERASITFAADELKFTTVPPDTIDIIAGASDFTAAATKFVAPCVARVTGCTDATANNTDYNVQAVAAAALTLFEADTVTAEASEAGTPTVKCLVASYTKIGPGKTVLLTDVTPADGLVLTAITGAIVAKVSYVGVAA
jgi:hypothetical protein